MGKPIGISTGAVRAFCVKWLVGKNPKHGMKAAAAEHFGVSRAAISYHFGKLRAGLPNLEFNFQAS